MTPSPAPQDFLPVTPVSFEILLSLTGGERHGYAIMRDIEERTGGAKSLHAGTLYRALARLVDTGLLEELDEDVVDDEGDERRRYYALTALGREVAVAEARRLESQVGAARLQGLLGGAGGS
ncbi:MAG TPA: PadR family transcriptional regulator [Longimicrobiales bacterium]|nr:PadR family transcriptional regulator [Longimicrobiales bacterium]